MKQICDGYEWRGDVPFKCQLPPGHKTADGVFLGRSCKGSGARYDAFDRLLGFGFTEQQAAALARADYTLFFVPADAVLGVAR